MKQSDRGDIVKARILLEEFVRANLISRESLCLSIVLDELAELERKAQELDRRVMTAKEDLYNWMVGNFEEAAMDTFSEIAKKHAFENGWDMIDVDLMVAELVENTKEGILNVIATYEPTKESNGVQVEWDGGMYVPICTRCGYDSLEIDYKHCPGCGTELIWERESEGE